MEQPDYLVQIGITPEHQKNEFMDEWLFNVLSGKELSEDMWEYVYNLYSLNEIILTVTEHEALADLCSHFINPSYHNTNFLYHIESYLRTINTIVAVAHRQCDSYRKMDLDGLVDFHVAISDLASKCDGLFNELLDAEEERLLEIEEKARKHVEEVQENLDSRASDDE